MIQHLNKRIRSAGDAGFTLIELLIVIVILGILSGVVVFAVGGITDRGKNAACASDKKTLQVAQEAYFAKTQPPSYATDAAALKAAGLIADVSTLYSTAGTATTHSETAIAAGGC